MDQDSAEVRLRRAARLVERAREAVPAIEQAICDLRREGWTTEAIISVAPWGSTHVNRVLKKHGLTTPRVPREQPGGSPAASG